MKMIQKNKNQKDEFISIRLITMDQKVNKSLVVNINMTTSSLLNLLNKTILEFYPNKHMNDFYFLYNGQKLWYSTYNLYQSGIRDGSFIFAGEAEDNDNEILEETNNNLHNMKLYDSNNLIRLNLVETSGVRINVAINKYKTCSDLINLLYKHLKRVYPNYSQSSFTFVYKGAKLSPNNRTLDESEFINGSSILLLVIHPMLEENLDMEASIIMNNEYHENFSFDLEGLLRLCLLKEISIYFYNNLDYYDKKVSNKVKYILEVISGGNIDLNQTQNSIMSVLTKLGGQCNIINFSKFIDENTNKEEIIEFFNILKQDEKKKLIEKKIVY